MTERYIRLHNFGRFIAIQKDLYDKKALELLDIDVIDGEIILQQKLEPKRTH
jgi:hypothetical protein